MAKLNKLLKMFGLFALGFTGLYFLVKGTSSYISSWVTTTPFMSIVVGSILLIGAMYMGFKVSK